MAGRIVTKRKNKQWCNIIIKDKKRFVREWRPIYAIFFVIHKIQQLTNNFISSRINYTYIYSERLIF